MANAHKYVNPKICIHSFLTTRRFEKQYYTMCDVCHLQGEPVTVGPIHWFSRLKSIRKFYQLANQVDKGSTEK